MMRKRSARQAIAMMWLLTAVILLSLAGCGFQPRGHSTGLAGIPNPIHIRGIASYSDLYRELHRQLGIAGVEVVEGTADAVPSLVFADVEADARLLSVNSRNKAVEYELIEEAEFVLLSADGRQLLAPQKLRALRIQYRPEDTVLGSDREAKILRQDMHEELARRILQRLATQRQNAP